MGSNEVFIVLRIKEFDFVNDLDETKILKVFRSLNKANKFKRKKQKEIQKRIQLSNKCIICNGYNESCKDYIENDNTYDETKYCENESADYYRGLYERIRVVKFEVEG